MMLYQKFRGSSLDISPLGLRCGSSVSDSVYTPTGARILAWLGDTDVHLCQVEGFGDMVFSVDPKAPPGDCIHPVSKTLADLIGLLTVCRHAQLITKAYQWSRTYFDRCMASIRPDPRTQSVLRALENTYHPPKIDDPYGYISDLQKDFDYSSLPLHPEFFHWCPIRPGGLKWNVGFGLDFLDYCEKNKSAQPLDIKKSFLWHDERWTIPAIYLCEQGIIVDSYMEISCEAMDKFHQKWSNRDLEHLSIEEKMRRTLEDPLDIEIKSTLAVNDRPTPLKYSFFLRWDPTLENPWNARRTLDHYGLDRDKAYLLRRECFLRKGKNPPIRTMDIKLEAVPVAVPGPRFIAPRPGEHMDFIHPSTGQMHTLTVTAQTREALDPNFLSNHPCCYTRLTYSVEPPLDRGSFSIVDCDPGDGFHGEQDTPSAVFLSGKIPAAGHFAVSSLRYAPADPITWRMIFRHKLRQDLLVRVLP